ncbi:MAG: hypothetical protein AAF697_14465, partial [Pseudomonadota bacterium]
CTTSISEFTIVYFGPWAFLWQCWRKGTLVPFEAAGKRHDQWKGHRPRLWSMRDKPAGWHCCGFRDGHCLFLRGYLAFEWCGLAAITFVALEGSKEPEKRATLGRTGKQNTDFAACPKTN